MNAFSKILILAMITFMSGASFAADAKVGENKSTDCPTVADNKGKAQDNKTSTEDGAKKPVKSDKAD